MVKNIEGKPSGSKRKSLNETPPVIDRNKGRGKVGSNPETASHGDAMASTPRSKKSKTVTNVPVRETRAGKRKKEVSEISELNLDQVPFHKRPKKGGNRNASASAVRSPSPEPGRSTSDNERNDQAESNQNFNAEPEQENKNEKIDTLMHTNDGVDLNVSGDDYDGQSSVGDEEENEYLSGELTSSDDEGSTTEGDTSAGDDLGSASESEDGEITFSQRSREKLELQRDPKIRALLKELVDERVDVKVKEHEREWERKSRHRSKSHARRQSRHRSRSNSRGRRHRSRYRSRSRSRSRRGSKSHARRRSRSRERSKYSPLRNCQSRVNAPKSPEQMKSIRPPAIKSPSDTTIYVPGLMKRNVKNVYRDQDVINKISNFVEGIRLDSDRPRSRSQRDHASHQGSEHRSSESPVVPRSEGNRRSESGRRSPEEDEMRETREATKKIILQAEKFKADVAAPKGKLPWDDNELEDRMIDLSKHRKEIEFRRLFDNDDDFFHVNCHIDPNLKSKIERGEFIELEKLLPK